MSRKTILIGILSLFLLLIAPAATYSAEYYLQYGGSAFNPESCVLKYNCALDSLSHYSNEGYPPYIQFGRYFCPVNFNVPDGSSCFIKSISIRYYDNRSDSYLQIQLLRKNLYNGTTHAVAEWSSGELFASGSFVTDHIGTIAGYKLVDTKRFKYYLMVRFVYPGVPDFTGMSLGQVRIHFGT